MLSKIQPWNFHTLRQHYSNANLSITFIAYYFPLIPSSLLLSSFFKAAKQIILPLVDFNY